MKQSRGILTDPEAGAVLAETGPLPRPLHANEVTVLVRTTANAMVRLDLVSAGRGEDKATVNLEQQCFDVLANRRLEVRTMIPLLAVGQGVRVALVAAVKGNAQATLEILSRT